MDVSRWLIMGVSGVFLRRNAWGRISDEPLVGEPADHRLLHLEFRQSLPTASHQLECAVLYPVKTLGRRAMCRERLIRPYRLEPLNQIARGYDLDAVLPYRLDRTRI